MMLNNEDFKNIFFVFEQCLPSNSSKTSSQKINTSKFQENDLQK